MTISSASTVPARGAAMQAGLQDHRKASANNLGVPRTIPHPGTTAHALLITTLSSNGKKECMAATPMPSNRMVRIALLVAPVLAATAVLTQAPTARPDVTFPSNAAVLEGIPRVRI